MSKKILITGVNGLLGQALYNYFINFSCYDLYGLGRSAQTVMTKNKNYYRIDLTDVKQLQALNNKFDVIIHAAALVNLSECHNNPSKAQALHIEATKNLITKLKNTQSQYIYISTDSVFDGQEGNYAETAITNPLNTYALTKLQGEKIIQDNLSNHLILRLNMFGYKFPMQSSLFEWAYKNLSHGIPIDGYDNVIFNPLYTLQIAQLIEVLIRINIQNGIYNLGSDTAYSKLQFLEMLCDHFQFPKSLLTNKTIDYQNSEIQRPYNTSLNISKIKNIIPNFDYSLHTGLELLKKDLNESIKIR